MSMVELFLAVIHSSSVSLYMLEALIPNGNITEANQQKAVADMRKSVTACNEFIKITVESLSGSHE